MKRFLNFSDFGMLLFRLTIGLVMAFNHGLSKVPPSEQFIDALTNMGFPLAIAFAWGAGLSEFLGGILIAAGLFARHAALFLGVTMSVAVFMAHGSDPFAKKEMAVLYLASSLLVALHGAGSYSLDRLFRKK